MPNLLSMLAGTFAATLHARGVVEGGWSFPFPPDAGAAVEEATHFLVLSDARRVDVMVRGDARDVIYYRPDQPGYAAHKAAAIRQGMLATGIDDPEDWEMQEIARLRRRA